MRHCGEVTGYHTVHHWASIRARGSCCISGLRLSMGTHIAATYHLHAHCGSHPASHGRPLDLDLLGHGHAHQRATAVLQATSLRGPPHGSHLRSSAGPNFGVTQAAICELRLNLRDSLHSILPVLALSSPILPKMPKLGCSDLRLNLPDIMHTLHALLLSTGPTWWSSGTSGAQRCGPTGTGRRLDWYGSMWCATGAHGRYGKELVLAGPYG